MPCDAYDFEHQLVAALPAVAAVAQSQDLRDALEQHLAETQTQIGRLTEVFTLLGEPPTRKHCAGMAGIREERLPDRRLPARGALRDGRVRHAGRMGAEAGVD